jgi:hypothetical protein
MTGKDRDHDQEMNRIETALIEDITARSDDEVLAEAKEDHGDIDAAAQNLRNLVSRALNRDARSKLESARAAVWVARAQRALRVIPGSFDTKKKLLLSVIAHQSANSQPLTLAARNADELTEADVDSVLQDMQDLGLIDDQGNLK